MALPRRLYANAVNQTELTYYTAMPEPIIKPTISVANFVNKLIATTTDFMGLSETESNAAWDDLRTQVSEKAKSDLLIKYMKRVDGWGKGAPYCVAAVGACVGITLDRMGFTAQATKFFKVWVAGVMNNVYEMQDRECLSKSPLRGSIWLARHGNTSKGHGGLVLEPKGANMATAEFNTSAGPTNDEELQRNGDGCYVRLRRLATNGGLITQGFVSPRAILAVSGLSGAQVSD